MPQFHISNCSVGDGIDLLSNLVAFIDCLKDVKTYGSNQNALKFAHIFQDSIHVPKNFCRKVKFFNFSPITYQIIFNFSFNILKNTSHPRPRACVCDFIGDMFSQNLAFYPENVQHFTTQEWELPKRYLFFVFDN